MSWAFLETMKTDYYWNISYVKVCFWSLGSTSSSAALIPILMQILQNARALLQEHYSQIPQLSCGFQFNLDSPFRI
jgi:hypothetical protein